MIDNENKNLTDGNQIDPDENPVEEMHLDDARRVKVLSPGMLVFKRFIRNRLAVIGLIILVFMFFFSFLGPFLSPYGQTQVFKGISTMSKEFASAIYNEELRFTVVQGENFGNSERAQFLLALGKNTDTFSHGDSTFYFTSEGENVYRILQLDPIAEELLGIFKPLTDETISDDFKAAYKSAREKDQKTFVLDGITYRITPKNKAFIISSEHDVAIALLWVYDAFDQANDAHVASFDFKLISSGAIAEGKSTFTVGDQLFSIRKDEGRNIIMDANKQDYAEVSDIIVRAIDKSVYLTVNFKSFVRQSIYDHLKEFTYIDENGQSVDYNIVRVNKTYNIKRETATELIRSFERPSSKHLLGLDNNGMDVLTRLMYGGRVSLMVGFVVILLEVLIGVVIGGISGYFGGWVDTSLMRFVDLFNSIPFYPMVLIFGSVMDALEVDPMLRIFLLMGVLGLLGWTGVARIVRGQILSFREQDFMIATEATGIRTSRRIFKHLVPNVMPLLIVQATAGLGGIIITEATLGFLGLGIKYPLASWGSIINVASDAYVMTNYWFMWIPAGTLILLTVLGFNFVGDGLRDAYDPKMKR